MTITFFLLGLVFLTTFFGLSLGLGLIFVKKYSIFNENVFLILPIGFVFFFALTFLAYLPFVIFQTSMLGIVIAEIIKDLGIIYYLIFNIRSYLKDFAKYLGQILIPILFFSGVVLLMQWFFLSNKGVPTDIGISGFIKYMANNFSLSNFNWFSGQVVSGRNTDFYSQTWYHFNALMLVTFQFNLNALMFWIDGFIIISFAFSTTLAFLNILTPKKQIIKYIITFCLILFFNLVIFHNIIFTNGLYFFSYAFLLTVILIFNLLVKRTKGMIYILNLTFLAAWSFNSNTVYVWLAIYYVFFVYSLFQKKTAVLDDVLPLSILPVLAISLLFLYSTGIIVSVLLLVAGIVLTIFYASFKIWNYHILQKVDMSLQRNAKIFAFSPFIIFFAISMLLLLNNRTDSWLNFNPKIDTEFGSTIINNDFDQMFRYAFYWVILISSFTLLLLKKYFRKELFFMIFLITFIILIFFNPLVAPTINGTLIRKENYSSFFFPIVICFCSSLTYFLMKIVRKKILFPIVNLLAIFGITIPITVNINQIKTNSFAYPTAGKDVEQLADFLNKNANSIYYKKPIEGDVRGLRAFVDFPLDFDSSENSIYYQNINTKFFVDNPKYNFNIDQNDRYVLIKKTNQVYANKNDLKKPFLEREFNQIYLNHDAGYQYAGFKSFVVIGQFVVYLPFKIDLLTNFNNSTKCLQNIYGKEQLF